MPGIPGGTVDWRSDVTWTPPGEGNPEDSDWLFLRATVWDFTSMVVEGITIDTGETGMASGVKCVVLGVNAEGGLLDQADCYVLVVRKLASGSTEGKELWERVGVGKIKGKFVDWATKGLPAVIG